MSLEPFAMSLRSKYNVKPGRGRKRFNKMLEIGVGLLIVFTLAGFFVSGFNFLALAGLSIPILILLRYRDRLENREHCVFCVAEVTLNSVQMEIKYLNIEKSLGSRHVTFLYKDIQTLEYSQEHSCLRITGKSDGTFGQHYLFVDRESEHSFLFKVKLYSQMDIVYMTS